MPETTASRAPIASTSRPPPTPALLESADRGEAKLLELPRAVPAVGAPAVAHAGPRLHPGPHRLARAHRRRGALGADVRAVVVLRRRAARGRGARADDARGARPRTCGSSCARRSPTRRATSRFFDRFYSEVGVLEADDLDGRLAETSEHLNPEFGELFDELLKQRVDRLAVEPEDLEALVEAVTIYHMIIEGMLALTGQHFIIDYNEREGTLPGFVEGFINVARDEHRHVAFGARFLRDMARRGPALRRGDPAHARPRSRRSPRACCGRSGSGRRRTRRRDLRRQRRGDARVRDEGARAPAEGHRPGAAA